MTPKFVSFVRHSRGWQSQRTDDVDNAASNDGPFAPDDIGHIARDERSEKGTAGQDGDDQRLVG
jgi:hypothetical protein